jgi:plastocyanin
VLLLAGCAPASGPPASVDEAACARPDGSGALSVAATQFAYDAPCLVVPAGVALIIRLENRDPAEHNISVYRDASRAEELFRGDLVGGPGRSIGYALGALAAGDYWFDCYLHPTRMSGALLVR